MLSPECLHEFRTAWLPHITPKGLDRLIDLLRTGSPLLIHGSFTRVVPMGCLATHAGWHHPETERLTLEAGICWLSRVAGLNPATSSVLQAWDRSSAHDTPLRGEFLSLLEEYRQKVKNLEGQISCPSSPLPTPCPA